MEHDAKRIVLIKHLVKKEPRDIEVLCDRVITRPLPPGFIAIGTEMLELPFNGFTIRLRFKEMSNIKESHSYSGCPMLIITMKDGGEYRLIVRYKGDRRA